MNLTAPEGFTLSEVKDFKDGIATFSISKGGHEWHCVYTKGKVGQKTLNAFIRNEMVKELENIIKGSN